ncbi:MAG: hypothetical protein ACM3RX_08590 [Methanococcaceae archaeon]|jgi:hypothetical protein
MTTKRLRNPGFLLSITLGLILATAAICLIISIIWPINNIKLISFLSDNWLLKIFKIQTNIINNPDCLLGVNLYDIGIILLFISICISLFAKFRYQYKAWFLISLTLLVFGLGIFLITHIAGRSTFMLGVLIISFFLVLKTTQNKIAGLLGIIASIFLLIGDFTVGSNLKIIALLFGGGYFFIITWLFMIAWILNSNENEKSKN